MPEGDLEKMVQLVEVLRARKPEWRFELEYPGCVSVSGPIPRVDVWFGTANETWGASMYGGDGGWDEGYIETFLFFETATLEALADRMIWCVQTAATLRHMAMMYGKKEVLAMCEAMMDFEEKEVTDGDVGERPDGQGEPVRG